MITVIVGFIKCQFLSTRVVIRMASSSLEDVELGFAEKPEDLSTLTSPYFPSKIGGKPAWLDPRLPVPEDLVCRKCSKPRVFLLQVYAPVDDLTHCYHRTLYIFCCREPSCHSRNYTEPFLVLRCNLPQTNPFYDGNESPGRVCGAVVQSKDVPDTANRDANSSESITTAVNSNMQDDSTSSTNRTQSSGDTVINSVTDININNEHLVQEQQNMSESLLLPSSLCAVCGCSGPKWCAKCHSMYYCSREHQVIHWKAGHKKYCGDDKQLTDAADVASGILFEEFEIVTEPEPPIKVTPEKSEEECMKDYHKFLQQQSGNSYSTKMDKMCLDEAEKDMKKDKQFMTFKKRIAVEPDQVKVIVYVYIEAMPCWLVI